MLEGVKVVLLKVEGFKSICILLLFLKMMSFNNFLLFIFYYEIIMKQLRQRKYEAIYVVIIIYDVM